MTLRSNDMRIRVNIIVALSAFLLTIASPCVFAQRVEWRPSFDMDIRDFLLFSQAELDDGVYSKAARNLSSNGVVFRMENVSKGIRLDKRDVRLFSILRSPDVFSNLDSSGMFNDQKSKEFVTWRSFRLASFVMPKFLDINAREQQFLNVSTSVHDRRIYLFVKSKEGESVGYIPMKTNLSYDSPESTRVSFLFVPRSRGKLVVPLDKESVAEREKSLSSILRTLVEEFGAKDPLGTLSMDGEVVVVEGTVGINLPPDRLSSRFNYGRSSFKCWASEEALLVHVSAYPDVTMKRYIGREFREDNYVTIPRMTPSIFEQGP